MWTYIASLPTIMMIKLMMQPILSHQHFPAFLIEGEEVLQAPEKWLVACTVKNKDIKAHRASFCPWLMQGKSLLFQDDPALSCKVAAIFSRLCSDAELNWSQEKLWSIMRLIFDLNCDCFKPLLSL